MLIENLEIDVKGRGLKIACLHNEWYDFDEDPSGFVDKLKGSGGRVDLFTFLQEIHEREPRFQFHREHDSVAVLPVSTYDHWWKNQIADKTRNMIRKTAKSGVELRCVEFDEHFVRGVMGVYQESPVRQGKPFWHYGKDFETVRRETGTFRERSRFVGAYYQGEMIGFSKLTRNANSASLMCIISMIAHRNKAPSNALIAKAVEMCAEAKIPYLQ